MSCEHLKSFPILSAILFSVCDFPTFKASIIWNIENQLFLEESKKEET